MKLLLQTDFFEKCCRTCKMMLIEILPDRNVISLEMKSNMLKDYNEFDEKKTDLIIEEPEIMDMTITEKNRNLSGTSSFVIKSKVKEDYNEETSSKMKAENSPPIILRKITQTVKLDHELIHHFEILIKE